MNTHQVAPQEGENTLLAARINAALEEKNLSIRDLALMTEGSYENIRKISKGLTSPSTFLLKVICQALDLNYREMSELANEDKIRRKYGDVPLKMSGLTDPTVEPVLRHWSALSVQQQKAVVTMVTSWANQNGAV